MHRRGELSPSAATPSPGPQETARAAAAGGGLPTLYRIHDRLRRDIVAFTATPSPTQALLLPTLQARPTAAAHSQHAAHEQRPSVRQTIGCSSGTASSVGTQTPKMNVPQRFEHTIPESLVDDPLAQLFMAVRASTPNRPTGWSSPRTAPHFLDQFSVRLKSRAE